MLGLLGTRTFRALSVIRDQTSLCSYFLQRKTTQPRIKSSTPCWGYLIKSPFLQMFPRDSPENRDQDFLLHAADRTPDILAIVGMVTQMWTDDVGVPFPGSHLYFHFSYIHFFSFNIFVFIWKLIKSHLITTHQMTHHFGKWCAN